MVGRVHKNVIRRGDFAAIQPDNPNGLFPPPFVAMDAYRVIISIMRLKFCAATHFLWCLYLLVGDEQ